MNFVPADTSRVLHDTWAFVHAGYVHVFYLAPAAADPMHRLIGHVVSRDWLTWEEQAYIELTGAPGTWDAGRIGTGHVFRFSDGRFYMAYTGRVDPQEDVGLAVSDDLFEWQKLSLDTPVWPRDLSIPYESETPEQGLAPAWRDPYVTLLPDGAWHAFLCAKSSRPGLAARACVAHARLESPTSWISLPPIADMGYYPIMEVPEVFELDDTWWLTFNTHSEWGRRLDTPSRRTAGGTFFLRAHAPDGPWERPDDDLLIGSGGNRHDAVVARSVMWKGERLIYHHYCGSMDTATSRALGLPKRLCRDGGRLVLRPWSGLSRLWTRSLLPVTWTPPLTGICAGGEWLPDSPGLRGRCDAGAAAAFGCLGTADLDMDIRIRLEAGERAGLAVGGAADGRGALLVCLDAKHNEVTLGEFRYGVFGPSCDRVLDTACRPVRHGVEYRIRLVIRDRYAEVFLDECLIFSTIKGNLGTGDYAALVVDSAIGYFRVERIHAIMPMIRNAQR